MILAKHATLLAWWFYQDNKYFGDNQPTVVIGEALTVEGEPIMRKYGLYASKTLLNALINAQSVLLHRVRIGGKIIQDEDDYTATERTSLWKLDCTAILYKFARECALEAISVSGLEPPKEVMKYLVTGHADLRETAWKTAHNVAIKIFNPLADATTWDSKHEAARQAAWAAECAAMSIAWEAARRACMMTRLAVWIAAMEEDTPRMEARNARLTELVVAEVREQGLNEIY